MTQGPQVIIVGAGILGLASAYHLLKSHAGLDLLVVERLAGSGQGDTARSAAAFRDMFSSAANRHLSQGAIAFYESIEAGSHRIGLKKIGYLWLATAGQMAAWRQALSHMAEAGVVFQTLERQDLAARLPELRPLDLSQGIFGVNCGSLDPARLTKFYEQEVLRLGGRYRYHSEVTGFKRDGRGRINGIRVGTAEIHAGTVIVATGAWTGRTMALAGLEIPMAPRKRQLFSLPAQAGALNRLLSTPGFNPYNVLPFTILPGGAYLRPAAASFILGYANPDQPPGLEEPADSPERFFRDPHSPPGSVIFPGFSGGRPHLCLGRALRRVSAGSHPVCGTPGRRHHRRRHQRQRGHESRFFGENCRRPLWRPGRRRAGSWRTFQDSRPQLAAAGRASGGIRDLIPGCIQRAIFGSRRL